MACRIPHCERSAQLQQWSVLPARFVCVLLTFPLRSLPLSGLYFLYLIIIIFLIFTFQLKWTFKISSSFRGGWSIFYQNPSILFIHKYFRMYL